MLYYKNKQWNVCSEKVNYIKDSIELENYVGQEGKQWWSDLAVLHENISIIGFVDVDICDRQIARLEEVNHLSIGDGYSTILADYVMRGEFPEEVNHVLKDLQSKKELEKAKQEIAFNNAISNLENLQLTESIKTNLEVAQAEANYELMMLVMTMGGN